MIRFYLKWFINIIALLVVIRVVGGVSIDKFETVVVASLVLGLLNAFIRPFIIILTLPVTILTFGAFTLVINGFLFYLAAKFIKGFIVTDFWSAFWAALWFSVISSALGFLLSPRISLRYRTLRPEGGRCRIIESDDVIDVECKPEENKERDEEAQTRP